MNLKTILSATIFLCAIGILFSCEDCDSCVDENERIDNIIAAYTDTIYAAPEKAVAAFSKYQSEVSDSDNYYKLELFKGIAAFITGRYDQFDSIHVEVDEYCKRHPDSHVIAGVKWNHQGMVQQNLGNADSAIVCYSSSCEELTKAGDWRRLSNVSINLADLYGSQGRMAEAAKSYRRVLFLADSLGNHDYDFSVLSGLAKVYADMGNYAESEIYFDMARPLVKSVSDFEAFFFYNSEGNSAFFRKQYDDAQVSFRKAYDIALRMGEENVLAIAETNLGEVKMCREELDSARYFVEKADARFRSLPALDESTRFYMNSLLAGLALRENNMQDAHRYLSMKVDTTALRPKYLSLHFHRLREYSVKVQDFKKAYEYELLASRYDSVLSNDMMRSRMAEIGYRYDQDTTLLHRNLKIKEQAEEMAELSMWNYAAVTAIVLLLVIAYLYFAYRKKEETVARLQMERSLVSLRVENIRNRVSPHFIFNVLNRELAAHNEGVDRLVRLLRMNLDLCDRYVVSLREELEFINIYVSLESKALGNDFDYSLEVDDNVDAEAYQLPSMMVQIFVENALKHGLRGVDGKKWLHLRVKHVGDSLEITVENNGSNHGVVAGRVGTGLKVVMQTIHILNERNTRKLELKYGATSSDVWNVRIVIPDGYDFSIMK